MQLENIEDDDLTIDHIIFNQFADKWNRTITSLAKMLDIPVAIIFKKEENKIRVIVTNEDNESNPFSVNDTIPIEGSFCHYVFKDDDKLLVPDYRDIDLDINNVATQADFISYLGYPLKWPNGEVFGTICFLDDTRNYYSNGVNEFLESLRDLLNDNLELIDTSYRIQHNRDQVKAKLEDREFDIKYSPMCVNCQRVKYKDTWININEFLVEYPEELVKSMPSDWSLQHSCKKAQ